MSGSGHDLSYDAADMDRWREVGWVPAPTSLFFQRSPWGWAFAKPYLYSVHLAPFVGLFGAVPGVAIANTVLLLALVGLAIATTTPGGVDRRIVQGDLDLPRGAGDSDAFT